MALPASTIVLNEIDAERALLGSLFAKPDAFGQVADTMNPAWFSDPLARYMFEECVKLAGEGHTLSTNVIISMLPEDCGQGVSRWIDTTGNPDAEGPAPGVKIVAPAHEDGAHGGHGHHH